MLVTYTEGPLRCTECGTPTGQSILKSVSHSKLHFIEFSTQLMIDFSMFETADIGGNQYKLKGLVRNYNNHFTYTLEISSKWTCFDDLCAY